MHRRHTFLESVENRLGCDFHYIFVILSAQAARCSRKRPPYWKMIWADGFDAKDRVGRPIRGRIRRIDLSMHASNGPTMCLARALLREYFRHRVGEGDLMLKRAAVPSPGGMSRWGTMPFNRSRGRLTAGKASDRSGVVVRHTTTSRVLGGWILRYRVGAGDLLLKRVAFLSPDGTARWDRCRRSGRQTD